jgi:hypothetical protein
MKTVGKRTGPRSPAECLILAEAIITEAEFLARTPARKSFVYKAPTREAYEAWKLRQSDPRYW